MRLPGLFGIRAISIALVLLYHLGSSALGPAFVAHHMSGVNIFFVLSGFLITYILCREEDKRGSISLQTFYVKRFLRILPPLIPYLAVLAILASMGIVKVALSDLGYCLLFVRNVFPIPNFSGSTQTDHLWTLAVEEQFYLLWPLLMILLGTNRARLRFSAALVVFSPVWHIIAFRLAGGAQYVNHVRFDLMYDPILIGCCLALARREPRLLQYLRHPWLQGRWFPVAAIVALLGVLWTGRLERLIYVVTALIINYAVEHEDGFLNFKPVMWLGKISYSLYIWQQLFCWGFSDHWLGRFPQNLLATLAVGLASFHLIEQPFTRLRERVRYKQNPPWLTRPLLGGRQVPESASALSSGD
ncbi:MAG TPA: acyltransferase [Bryobacteraceae bacterium]|nr:acyltransferase [Bryobacteraceae bacterium]